jgi:hypothetical protein
MKHNIRISESELHNLIKESVVNALNEARGVKSQKLYDIMQQHGGIYSNHGVFDIHNLTDNDIIDVISYQELKNIHNQGIRNYAKQNSIELGIGDMLDTIELNDGNYILCKLRGGRFDSITKKDNAEREKLPGDFELLHNKTEERRRNRYPRKNDYVWNNKDAEDIFHNPYFRKGEGNWTPERKTEVMNNIKNGKRWFERK